MSELRPVEQKNLLPRDQPADVEENLRQERDLISAILDAVGALIVVLDGQGRIVRFNHACEQTTGFSLDEVSGQYVWDLFLIPEQVEPVRTDFAELQADEFPNEYENIWVTREGDHRLITWSNTALVSQDGEVEYVIGTGIDITERRQAEGALQELSHDLGERVKELTCLYGVSALVEKPGISLAEILEGTVALVPPAWQYPDITAARVILDDQEFSTENFRETAWIQACDLRVHGSTAGRLEACYLEERRESDEGPFLREERSLIEAIALRLGRIVERLRAEDALDLSEERYALAQRAANMGSWDWDIRTNDLHWSDPVEPMFGFGRGEFGATYEAFLQCVHPDDLQYVVGSVNACVQGGEDYGVEHRIVWPDGTIHWVSETGDVIRDEHGTPLRMLGVVQDITEHKQAEEQVRRHDEFLTSVLESLTHPFYVLDVGDYTIQMSNTAAHPGSLPEHSTCYALLHGQSEPCREPGHVCPIEEIKRTKKSVTVEHVHIDAEGNERNVEVRGYPLFDDEGNVARVIEYSFDITDRRQAEEDLRQSEARWRLVTENSPDHVILLDTDLNIQFVNYPSPGLTAEELIGTPLYTYVSAERQSEIKRILESVLKTVEPTAYETEFSTPDGNTIYYESRVVPRTLDGQIIGLALNARDITERKQAHRDLLEAKEAAEEARRDEETRRREADSRRQIAESLAHVLAALNSNQPLAQVLDYIAEQVSDLLDTQAVAIRVMRGGAEVAAVEAAQGLLADSTAGQDTPPGVEVLTQAVSTRQVVAVPDVATAPAHLVSSVEQSVPGESGVVPFRALLAVPIVVQDEVYGGVVLYYAQPRSFSDEEVELAAVFSNQIALAIENARLREQVRQAAAASERSRLARDLHDSVTQALFSASLVAEVLPRVWERDPEEARNGLEELRHLTRGALAEMRTMLLELRPTALVETKLDDLLRQLTEAVTSRAELPVVVNIEPSPTLPPDVHVAFYRIAQESLHNVVKHAEASQLGVSFRALPPVSREWADSWQGRVNLCVSDNGRGFDAAQTRGDQLGLGIMRERAEAIGAKLTIDSQPDHGTQVALDWESALP